MRGPAEGSPRPGRPLSSGQLGDRVAGGVHDPDVGAVEGHAGWGIAHGGAAQIGAVARPELRDVLGREVHYPNVGAIEGHAIRLTAYRECSKVVAVARPQ